MMSRIPLLTGILIAQLALVGLILLGGNDEPSSVTLLDFDASDVTSLTIEDGDGNTVDLFRSDAGWRLGELPADASKIAGVIESLAGGSAGWPVATSEDSQSRFEVTADAFQRRVRFGGASGELAVLYIGSSPGFRRVHARRDGEDAVFSIDFAVHELTADRGDWLNRYLFSAEGITRVVLPSGEALAADGEGGWSIDGRVVDGEAAGDFVDRVARLSVLGFAGDMPDEGLGEPQILSVEDALGSHTLSFRFHETDDEYVLTSDRFPGRFTVASYLAEQILIPADALEPAAETGEEAVAAPDENG